MGAIIVNCLVINIHRVGRVRISVWLVYPDKSSGPWFNIEMSSYQCRKSHCGDKTVVRSSYLHSGISYTGKVTSLYWFDPLDAKVFGWMCWTVLDFRNDHIPPQRLGIYYKMKIKWSHLWTPSCCYRFTSEGSINDQTWQQAMFCVLLETQVINWMFFFYWRLYNQSSSAMETHVSIISFLTIRTHLMNVNNHDVKVSVATYSKILHRAIC